MPKQFGVPDEVIKAVVDRQEPLSAYSPYLSPIHGKHIIGVNAAFMLGRWIDILFFGDGGFYWNNKKAICEFPNLRVTCNPNINKRSGVYNVKHVPRDNNHPMGISTRPHRVSWNKNSGGAAINFAYHLGVKRIFLVGFDMKRAEDGIAEHWHSVYRKLESSRPLQHLPYKKHLPSFTPIANDARRHGLEIINVGRESAITVFKRVTLEEALKL